MVKLADLQEIKNTAQPTAGMGLALDINGFVDDRNVRNPAIQVSRSGNQSINNNVATVVIFNAIEATNDQRGTYSLNTGTGRVTISEPGIFICTGEVQFDITGSTAGDRLSILTIASGATELARSYVPGTYFFPALSAITYVLPTSRGGATGTQTVDVNCFQNSGGALNVTLARMTVVKLCSL